MATEARVGGTPGSDINLILVRNPPAWSPAQAFAYALGAPYHMMHDVPLNALPTPKSRLLQTVSGMLKDAWAIEGGEDLLRTLNWLGAEGHRRSNSMKIRSYSLLRRPAVAARREELRDLGQEDPQGLEELGRLDAVQANTDGIRSGVLIGFDAARAVMLARNGWLLGWLSEERLWDYVFDVARDVQHRFTSWADYAADFRISRNFWQGANERKQIDVIFDVIIKRLLTEAGSSWRSLPWPVPGLEVPRPVRPIDSAAPMWTLERWDS